MTEPQYGDELAVVTVTYASGRTVDRFLDTLPSATKRPDVPVVVVDNGSTDGAPERAATRDNVTLISTGENLGYGCAANRGVASLGPEYGWVVVANPDMEWQDGTIDTMIDAADRWPRGGEFGPLIREPGGKVYPSARQLPAIGRGIGHALFSKVWPSNPWTATYKQSTGEPVERVSGWLSGSCQLFRRSAWESVNGFDPRYFMYFEDVDLGDRLAKAGWQCVYVPSAEVMHIQGHSSASSSGHSSRMLREHHASAYRYIADRHQGWRWAPLRAAIRTGLSLRARIASR